MGLRLLVYDRTCRGRAWRPGLSAAWQAGSWLYRGLGRLDGARGVDSWCEALAWLGALRAEQPIDEVQYWGHGKWGCARVRDDVLDIGALTARHPLHPGLLRLRQRMHPEALLWFRTCETFGASAGQRFAGAIADFMGCAVAGHTHIIGYYQSGLHRLDPGREPHWAADEGLVRGTPDAPEQARWSRRSLPNTISCLQGTIPDPRW